MWASKKRALCKIKTVKSDFNFKLYNDKVHVLWHCLGESARWSDKEIQGFSRTWQHQDSCSRMSVITLKAQKLELVPRYKISENLSSMCSKY